MGEALAMARHQPLLDPNDPELLAWRREKELERLMAPVHVQHQPGPWEPLRKPVSAHRPRRAPDPEDE